ncbi:similar to Saccharomyces cerevisiae YIL107C PFK26 6-phosphofructo-2-kinase, inhibited by phosphoenolpyruvate and sn-glycerol 3-phosphate [Geotrichum candidum]|nr:similar to Saccharomyces cerevisiae YIL107C PFK26 6-phosphofructo-2-kinase, inhibited by phosphoenolpyruvate and sn-glycerol 3-phosphate [Geotrichum candidum]
MVSMASTPCGTPLTPTTTNSSLRRKPSAAFDVPGLTRSRASPDGLCNTIDTKLLIVMVGLPARGKSYITKKICRYMNWQRYKTRIFNVGNTRRSNCENNNDSAPVSAESESQTTHSAEFFDPNNDKSIQMREKWAMDTLDELLDFLIHGDGCIGLFDATNTSVARRRKIINHVRERTDGKLKILFVESICDNDAIIQKNVHLKLSGPDYKNVDKEVALQDFLGRMKNYEKVYETIQESEETSEIQYIKLINVGKKVIMYNVNGFLSEQVVGFLMNFNLAERQIWISRAAESESEAQDRLGGDSPVTAAGHGYAEAAARFISQQKSAFFADQVEHLVVQAQEDGTPLAPVLSNLQESSFSVWTSMNCSAIETGAHFDDSVFDVKAMKMLNELNYGSFEGLTLSEIQRSYPYEYNAQITNGERYKYPGSGGESYLDVINRVRPVVLELERMVDNSLIISHPIMCQALLAYFLNLDSTNSFEVPANTLFSVQRKPYGVEWEAYQYDASIDSFVKLDTTSDISIVATPQHRPPTGSDTLASVVAGPMVPSLMNA